VTAAVDRSLAMPKLSRLYFIEVWPLGHRDLLC
jgi:hypothetical protein